MRSWFSSNTRGAVSVYHSQTGAPTKSGNKKPGRMWERTQLMPKNIEVERDRAECIPEETLLHSIELCIKNCPWVHHAGVYYIGKKKYTQRQLDEMRARVANKSNN